MAGLIFIASTITLDAARIANGSSICWRCSVADVSGSKLRLAPTGAVSEWTTCLVLMSPSGTQSARGRSGHAVASQPLNRYVITR